MLPVPTKTPGQCLPPQGSGSCHIRGCHVLEWRPCTRGRDQGGSRGDLRGIPPLFRGSKKVEASRVLALALVGHPRGWGGSLLRQTSLEVRTMDVGTRLPSSASTIS